MQQENEDIQNGLIRSTFIFCGVPESEKNYDWDEVNIKWDNFGFLAHWIHAGTLLETFPPKWHPWLTFPLQISVDASFDDAISLTATQLQLVVIPLLM